MIRSVPAEESRGGTGRIDVSVVTPSFNMLNYLQRCCASVADQEYVTHEHIVVDGGSTDETPEWLSCQASLISQSQRTTACMMRSTEAFGSRAERLSLI